MGWLHKHVTGHLHDALLHPTSTAVGLAGGNKSQQNWGSYLSPAPQESMGRNGLWNNDSVKHFSWWSNHDEHDAASKARIAAATENRTVAGNVDYLRAMYGTYEGANPGLAAQSAENGQALQQNHEHYRQAYLDYFNPQLDDQFNTAQHNDVFAGVNTGTSGGSADEIRKTKTLGTYATAQQQLGSRANNTVNDLVQGDHDTEMQLEDQIRHGGDASYLMSSGLRQTQANLAHAQSQIPSEALGDIFNNAGNLYEQGQLATGYGRRGLGVRSSDSLFANG
jgi:hypothetical protein